VRLDIAEWREKKHPAAEPHEQSHAAGHALPAARFRAAHSHDTILSRPTPSRPSRPNVP